MTSKTFDPIDMVDQFVSATQFAGQFFGFLSDDREKVDIVEEGEVLLVSLPDRTKDGWPKVSVQMPRVFRFRQATSSVLTRTAGFFAPGTLAEAKGWYREAGLDFPEESCAELGNGASVRISADDGQVSVVITQRRKEAALKASILSHLDECQSSF